LQRNEAEVSTCPVASAGTVVSFDPADQKPEKITGEPGLDRKRAERRWKITFLLSPVHAVNFADNSVGRALGAPIWTS